VRVVLTFKNIGKTPAEIIAEDASILAGGLRDPEFPPIQGDAKPISTLMPGDFVHDVRSFVVSAADAAGARPLFLVGWLLYRDKFGFTHRFCYAKRYLPAVPVHGNNLANVMLAGYNQEHDVTTPAWWESV